MPTARSSYLSLIVVSDSVANLLTGRMNHPWSKYMRSPSYPTVRRWLYTLQVPGVSLETLKSLFVSAGAEAQVQRLSKAGSRALGPSSLCRTATEHPRRPPRPAGPRLRVGEAAAMRRGRTSLHRGGLRAREQVLE